MANRARKYISAESLAVSTSALATDTTKVTLTFTPDASSTYLYIWSCDVAGSGTTLDSIVTLKNNAGSTLSTTNYESKDATADFATLSGIAFETFGASPTSQSVTLTWRAETTSLTSSIRNARVIAIKLNSTDAFVENTADVTNATTTLAAATTLTFTPPSTGNYLILGSCEIKTPATTASCISQITYSGVGYSDSTMAPNDATNYMSGLMSVPLSSLTATSKTITLDFARVAGSGTVNCRRARLVALRLDEFTDSSITSDTSLTSTINPSYFNKATTGAVSTTSGLDYLVIGTASISGSSTTISVGHGLRVDGVYVSESFQESALAGTLASGHFGAFDVITAGSSTTVNFNYYAETTSASSTAGEVYLSVLLLDPTELYWVGGTGTWDATTTTKWAVSSGGTGGAAAPKIGTNVNFDSTSSSDTLFATTVYTVSSSYTGGTGNNPPTYQYMNDSNANGSTNDKQWGNNTESNPFIKADLGSTQTLSKIIIGYDYLNNLPNSWGVTYTEGLSVQTSTDNTNWTTQATTPTYASSGSTNGLVTISLSGISARYVRLTKASGFMATLEFQVWVAGSSAFTATVGTGAVCKNLTASGLAATMTLAGSAAMSVYGNFSVPASNFTQSYTGTITFAGTGSQTITTNGKSFTAFTFDGVGGTWTLQDALTLTGAATLTNGTLALGAYTFSCLTFSSSNANVRTISFGTGKIVITSATATTVWTTTTITNLTVSGTPLVELTGGGATTKTISAGALSEANSISFTLSTTDGTVAFTASNTVRNLTIANNSFTLSNIAITIYGNLIVGGTTVTLTAGANAWTFAATSGTKTITTNGETLDFPITFNGVDGTWALQDALTLGVSTSRTVTLTNGTLDLNSYSFTLFGVFSSSTTTTRRLQNTGGTTNAIILTLNTSATVWSCATLTGMTTDGNFNVQFANTGAAAKTVAHGTTGGSESNAVSFEILASFVNTLTLNGGSVVKNLILRNAVYTLSCGNLTIYGDLNIAGTSPEILNATSSSWTFGATSGTKTITTSGEIIDFPITFNGVGGTWQLQDNLAVGVAISRTVTLTNGTLDLNEFNLTLYGLFSSTSANTRSIDFGAVSKIILTLYGATVFNTSGSSNLTISGTYPLIQVIPTISSQTSTLTFGTSVQNSINVQLSPTVTTTVVLTGTIRDLIIDNFDITLANGTRTIVGDFIVSGTTPTLNSGTSVTTFRSTTGGVTNIINLNGNNSNTLDFPITIDVGTRQLTHNLNIGSATSRTVTLTGATAGAPTEIGALDLNEYTLKVYGTFVSGSDETLAREIDFGTAGKIQLSLAGVTATTIWNVVTRNITISGNSLVEVIGAGTLVRTITGIVPGTGTGELGSVNISVLTSAGTATITGELKNLTLNCAGTTITNSTRKLYGNLNVVSATLTAGTLITTFAATSGTKTITTNGNSIVFPITIDGVGGTTQLSDALTMNSSRVITLTSGTFSLNDYTCTAAGGFAVTGTNTKVLAHGTSDLVISLAGATAFNATGSNLTSTGTGKIDMTSASAKTFVANGNFYTTLNQGGIGTLTVASGPPNTGSLQAYFNNITNSVSNTTINFQRNSNYTFSNNFQLSGANSAFPIIIESTTPATTSDPIEGGLYVTLTYTGSEKINLRNVKIFNYSVKASPENNWYVRDSDKVVASGPIFYNDDSTTLAGYGSETSNGWVFIREKAFFNFL